MKKVVFITCLVLTQAMSSHTMVAMTGPVDKTGDTKHSTPLFPVPTAGLEKDPDLADEIKELTIHADPSDKAPSYTIENVESMIAYLEYVFAHPEEPRYKAAQQKHATLYSIKAAQQYVLCSIHAYILFTFAYENMLKAHDEKNPKTPIFFLDLLNYYFTKHANQCTSVFHEELGCSRLQWARCKEMDSWSFAQFVKTTIAFKLPKNFYKKSLLLAAHSRNYHSVLLMLLYLGLDPNCTTIGRSLRMPC